MPKEKHITYMGITCYSVINLLYVYLVVFIKLVILELLGFMGINRYLFYILRGFSITYRRVATCCCCFGYLGETCSIASLVITCYMKYRNNCRLSGWPVCFLSPGSEPP